MRAKRDRLLEGLRTTAMDVIAPAGRYFITGDIGPLGESDGMAFCRSLPARCGVVAVPDLVFYDDVEEGSPLIRYTFRRRRGRPRG